MPLENFRSCTSAACVKSHALEKLIDALATLGRAIAEKSRVVIQQLARRQVVVEVRLLRQVSDVAMHADVSIDCPQHARRSRSREDQAHQKF